MFLIQSQGFSSPLWNIETGVNLINSEKYADAAKFFEGYTKSNPNDSDGHYYLGLCYKNLNKMEKSAYHLQKSYELSRNLEKINVAPKYTSKSSAEDDYLDMANMYYDSGNYIKALQYTDLILNVNPNNINGLILKTKIYYNQNNKNQAVVYFKKALMLDNTLLTSVWAKNLGINTIPKYDFDYYNTKGLEYYYSGDPKGAINYFTKALDMNPKNAQALNNLALCYLQLNDFDSAKNTLNKALRADKNFNLTYINLAKYEALKDSALKKTGVNKQREKYLKEALKVNPNSKYAYLELGNFYLENKDYQNANINFKNAVLIDGNFYEALMGLGISYVEEGNLADAIKVLRKASTLTAQEKNPDMLYYLAKICVANANFKEGKEYLLEALKMSENHNYYFELGKIYYSEGDYSSAQNAFKKAMELDLDFELEADIYNYMGLVEYKNFDTNQAIYMFKKAVELDPKRAMYLYNLAQAYKSLGDKNAYSKEINAIANLKPRTVQDFIDFSTIYYDKKNTPVAIKVLDDGISKYPDERSLYEAKLKLFRATKDTKGIKDTESQIRMKFRK